MEMGIENYPRIQLELFVLATVLERIYKDVAASGGGEDGKPGNGGGGDKVGVSVFENSVAAPHMGGLRAEAQLRR
jgi:hypothetical protein